MLGWQVGMIACRDCNYWVRAVAEPDEKHGVLGICMFRFPPNGPPSGVPAQVNYSYASQGCDLGVLRVRDQ